MISVEKPTPGSVTIELPYDEAEVLCRAVGMVNTGNLRTHAPNLFEAVEKLVTEFGRNIDSEARRYMITSRAGQLFVLFVDDGEEW